MTRLDYSVTDCSGHSSGYVAQHIMVDQPNDQASRWSSLTNDQNQFVLMKLERPALVRTITFGKYFKTHVCNLKEFKVLAGSSEHNMTEVVHSGLRNDSEPETFPFSWSGEESKLCPVQFVKIVPMAAWGNNFNFSIWYVELRGFADPQLVRMAHRMFVERQKQRAWRLLLKFLKGESQVPLPVLTQLETVSGCSGEAALVQSLYQLVVERGDFGGAEALLKDAAQVQDLFTEYIQDHVPYECRWSKVEPSGSEPVPSRRGGHQMCWDPVSSRVILFGGWDGNQDLADFWMWDSQSQYWTCLSPDTRLENGPGPRSCHKICLHAGRRLLYVFGRFVEQDSRTGTGNVSLAAEFYQYDLEAHCWTLLSEDVGMEGGPSLVYDHQMVVDEEMDQIWVFGGRVISSAVVGEDPQYSGLYVYHIREGRWECVRPDAFDHQPPKTPSLRARIGHSMILDPALRQLHIFAGQRNKDYLADYYVYDVGTDTVVGWEKDTSRGGGPDPGFTQRSTIDLGRGEIYLFTGLMKERTPPTNNTSTNPTTQSSGEMSRNTFWVYHMASRKWTRLEQRPEHGEWPCPRFAHQLVYDPTTRTHYLFGGNPGEPGAPKRRLNDFWRLRLERPMDVGAVLRRAAFLTRRQHYYELCLVQGGQMEALRYLQTDLASVVRHEDPAESAEFRSLSAWLFQSVPGSASPIASSPRSPLLGLGSYLAEAADQVQLSRQQLFTDLARLLPRAMRPPTDSLLDLV